MDIVIKLLGRGMTFYTFDDFMKKRYFIKDTLDKKYPDGEYFTIYRWYVQSRYWIKDKYKYLIWDYLNGYETEETLIEEYNNYVLKRGDTIA